LPHTTAAAALLMTQTAGVQPIGRTATAMLLHLFYYKCWCW